MSRHERAHRRGRRDRDPAGRRAARGARRHGPRRRPRQGGGLRDPRRPLPARVGHRPRRPQGRRRRARRRVHRLHLERRRERARVPGRQGPGREGDAGVRHAPALRRRLQGQGRVPDGRAADRQGAVAAADPRPPDRRHRACAAGRRQRQVLARPRDDARVPDGARRPLPRRAARRPAPARRRAPRRPHPRRRVRDPDGRDDAGPGRHVRVPRRHAGDEGGQAAVRPAPALAERGDRGGRQRRVHGRRGPGVRQGQHHDHRGGRGALREARAVAAARARPQGRRHRRRAPAAGARRGRRRARRRHRRRRQQPPRLPAGQAARHPQGRDARRPGAQPPPVQPRGHRRPPHTARRRGAGGPELAEDRQGRAHRQHRGPRRGHGGQLPRRRRAGAGRRARLARRHPDRRRRAGHERDHPPRQHGDPARRPPAAGDVPRQRGGSRGVARGSAPGRQGVRRAGTPGVPVGAAGPTGPTPEPTSGRGRFAPYVLGTVLLALAAVTLALLAYAAVVGEPVLGFAAFLAVAVPTGALLRWQGRSEAEPGRREAIATVLLTWLTVPLLGTVPYLVTLGLPFTQAVFESMSGFTSTGATVLTTFETLPRSLLLWRAVTQWVGGIGIIVLFVAVFPQLSIAGRQMFFTELPGVKDERITPRLRTTAAAVLSVYAGLTVLCAAAFALRGMPLVEALGHSLATVSAGGFAMHDVGLAHYLDPGIEWVAVAFMLVAGLSMPLLWRALFGRPGLLLRDAEVRVYLGVAAAASLALALLLREDGGLPLRQGVFHAVSVITTTGYSTSDFAAWA